MPNKKAPHVQEAHPLIIHCLCPLMGKKVFCLLLTIPLLSCAAPAPHHVPVRSAGTSLDDRTIERRLRREIIVLGDQTPLRVKVEVFNGVVLLMGEVETIAAKNFLENKAARLRETDKVFNRIEVTKPLPRYGGFRDLLLAGRVHFALTSIKELNDIDMTYIVDRRRIYLLGIVTPAQAELTIDRLSQLAGVDTIVAAYEYLVR